jgi:hypothetical protein
VTHHILCDVDGYVTPAIVHGDRVAHHLRKNGAVPRPGANDLAAIRIVQVFDLLQ